jgi:hypothetical protein
MTLRQILFASALAAAGVVPAGAAQAGFFESLFGSPAEPSVASAPAPAEISVTPSRQRRYRSQATVRRTARVRLGTRATQKMASIDPQQDQEWFLHDPTLRPGDVVVLTRGAFVFNGKSRALPYTTSDFVPLEKSTLISDASRRQINLIAPRVDQYASTVPDTSGMIAALGK